MLPACCTALNQPHHAWSAGPGRLGPAAASRGRAPPVNTRTRPWVKEEPVSRTKGAAFSQSCRFRASIPPLCLCATPSRTGASPATLTVAAPALSRMSASVRSVRGECSAPPPGSARSRLRRSSSSSEQRKHTHTRALTHRSDAERAAMEMKRQPARMRTTPTESKRQHVRDSSERLRGRDGGSTPTAISVTGTFHNIKAR